MQEEPLLVGAAAASSTVEHIDVVMEPRTHRGHRPFVRRSYDAVATSGVSSHLDRRIQTLVPLLVGRHRGLEWSVGLTQWGKLH